MQRHGVSGGADDCNDMASMSHDDYGRELTDASFAELKEFLKRMDVKRGACPI